MTVTNDAAQAHLTGVHHDAHDHLDTRAVPAATVTGARRPQELAVVLARSRCTASGRSRSSGERQHASSTRGSRRRR
ncbi:hypothetical protein DDP54_00560 (plasmid) [Cellulomonas sp. WB94]|nr:hypothetical protein DDP54_00560 [Cellulomonas sp. WB94]